VHGPKRSGELVKWTVADTTGRINRRPFRTEGSQAAEVEKKHLAIRLHLQ